jgi:lipopolysaccharide export system protein LptA
MNGTSDMITAKRIFLAILVLAGNTASPILIALSQDQQQPISISADQAEIDQTKGFSFYSGAVIVTQGSMIINAERVEIHYVDDELSLILATGKPAHFQQQVNNTGNLTHAWGETIRYQISDEQLVITTAAKLEQQGNTTSGDRIVYLSQQDKVSAFSNTSGKQRVQMIIKPKPKP